MLPAGVHVRSASPRSVSVLLSKALAVAAVLTQQACHGSLISS